MKIGKTFLITYVFIYILLFSACKSNYSTNQDVKEYKIQNEELKLKVTDLEKLLQTYKDIEDDKLQNEELILSSNVQEILHVKELNGTFFIVLSVSGNKTGNVQLWEYNGKPFATLLEEGIDINIETRDPYLYCTVTKSIGEGEYKEEVIKYDRDNNKSLIYEGINVEISSSPEGEYFIIIENPYFLDRNLDSVRNLKILDRNDKIIFDKIIESKMDTDLLPYGWNDKKFWGVFSLMAGRPEILILDTETFDFEVIENKADYCEFDLNMKNGWICYSDFPQFYDIDTYNEFKQSDKEIHLYLWNLFTDKRINIATSVAKSFNPKWVNQYTFEYNNPINEQRIRYTLKTDKH